MKEISTYRFLHQVRIYVVFTTSFIGLSLSDSNTPMLGICLSILSLIISLTSLPILRSPLSSKASLYLGISIIFSFYAFGVSGLFKVLSFIISYLAIWIQIKSKIFNRGTIINGIVFYVALFFVFWILETGLLISFYEYSSRPISRLYFLADTTILLPVLTIFLCNHFYSDKKYLMFIFFVLLLLLIGRRVSLFLIPLILAYHSRFLFLKNFKVVLVLVISIVYILSLSRISEELKVDISGLRTAAQSESSDIERLYYVDRATTIYYRSDFVTKIFGSSLNGMNLKRGQRYQHFHNTILTSLMYGGWLLTSAFALLIFLSRHNWSHHMPVMAVIATESIFYLPNTLSLVFLLLMTTQVGNDKMQSEIC